MEAAVYRPGDRAAESHAGFRLIGMVALCTFIVREPFSGLVQYYLSMFGATPVWFSADFLSAICFLCVLAEGILGGSALLLFICVFSVYYCILGYVVSESALSVVAGIKAVLPFFVGVLTRRDMFSGKASSAFVYSLLIAACVGLFLSLNFTLPWENLSLDAGFGLKQVTKLSWSADGVRGFGFASDAHSCALGIMVLWLFAGLGRRDNTSYLCGLLAAISIYLTTSKTVFVCFSLLLVLRYIQDRADQSSRDLFHSVLKIMVSGSIVAPIAVIIFSAVVDRDALPFSLMGLWDRGGRVYLEPFEFMQSYFPVAWATGFGLGGIGFPLMKSDHVEYASVVDNFTLWGYYSFGLPFLLLLAGLIPAVMRSSDRDDRLIFGVMFLLGQFILGWASPLFLLVLGFVLSRYVRAPQPTPSTSLRLDRRRDVARQHQGAHALSRFPSHE